jgi:hypothetical protein
MSTIAGNMVGTYSSIGKTLLLTDESGVEITGVIVGQEVIFTANAATDIREGKVAATDEGVVTGSKVIPSYHTNHGARLIDAGDEFVIRLAKLDCYDYTNFHGIICEWNTNLSNSVAANRIVVLDAVYPVLSTEEISIVTKDADSKSVIFGITNNTDAPCVVRYMTYKEIE